MQGINLAQASDVRVGRQYNLDHNYDVLVKKVYMCSNLIWERNFSRDYFTITPRINTYIYYENTVDQSKNIGPIDYSIDDGNTWTTINEGEHTVEVDAGCHVKFRKIAVQNDDYHIANSGRFTTYTPPAANPQFEVSGNIMSLVDGDNFLSSTSIPDNYFMSMFGYANVTDARYLIFPSFTSHDCYNYMFVHSRLIYAPLVLPALSLAGWCYERMFYECSRLITAPTLPATTMSYGCYSEMFYGCSSLQIAPNLQATTLDQSCYQRMFYRCSSLIDVLCLASTNQVQDATTDWLYGVSATGTMGIANNSSWTSGASGIPVGWTTYIVN